MVFVILVLVGLAVLLASLRRPALHVDDGSTDDTPAILERLAGCHPGFIRVVTAGTAAPGPTTATGVEALERICSPDREGKRNQGPEGQ